MMEGKCKCPHHACTKVMLALLWFSALGFWWATAFKTNLLWMDGEHFFKDVVVLALLMFASKKFCGCCGSMGGHGSMAGGSTCSHGENCSMCK